MKSPSYFWPLNAPSFTFLDKLKISKFIFTEDRWTQGEWVRKYEETWEEYTGANHAVFVASGSAANELIALRRREELRRVASWPKRRKVVFPAVTWISSISPWVNFDFEPVFMDVTGATLNSCYNDVKKVLDADTAGEISTVFYTSLLGFSEDLMKIKDLCNERNVALMLDNCESSFSWVADNIKKATHLCAFVTSSTSMYFSHLTTTGTEGGMVFCRDDEEYEWYKMARAHGMTRGLPNKYKNPEVDPLFDFYMMGSNYRSHNLAAFMGLLDFERALDFSTNTDKYHSRIRLSNLFMSALNDSYLKPHLQDYDDNAPFALPIVASQKAKPGLMRQVRMTLDLAGVESRPLISGNLLRQTAFKKYGNPLDFPGAEWLHHNACYVGLHQNVTQKHILRLASGLNILTR